MEIVRTARVEEYECYRLEVDEDLAQACEEALKRVAVNPDNVPHLSPQTLMQCWEDEGSRKLQDYELDIKGYSCSYMVYLVEWVREWLSDVLWEQEPTYGDRNAIDYEDDIDWHGNDEYRCIFEDVNPDFEDDEDSSFVISPEGNNDTQ